MSLSDEKERLALWLRLRAAGWTEAEIASRWKVKAEQVSNALRLADDKGLRVSDRPGVRRVEVVRTTWDMTRRDLIALPRDPWTSEPIRPLSDRPETAPRPTPRHLPPLRPLTGAARVSWFKRALREAMQEGRE